MKFSTLGLTAAALVAWLSLIPVSRLEGQAKGSLSELDIENSQLKVNLEKALGDNKQLRDALAETRQAADQRRVADFGFLRLRTRKSNGSKTDPNRRKRSEQGSRSHGTLLYAERRQRRLCFRLLIRAARTCAEPPLAARLNLHLAAIYEELDAIDKACAIGG